MYLKNITLKGFKSFATRSQLFFEPGISVIVGPNGSGKSNIADAISWVLGEQSPKSLRGSSMEDVIFRSRQEELGIAEVSLLFDNADRFIPSEFKEIKFTRRVYAKGGSEYFINSSPSRLLDIQDITSDRGIGKGLYTIINQGQINEIAILKPLERKLIIDEIIGTAKHKIRREKSKNKLLKVSDDIERIDDLMLEVKRTMDPLEIESRKAQKYFEILNNLKSEEISLFLSELNTLNRNWENENNNYEKSVIKIDEIDKNIKNLEKQRTDFENLMSTNKKKYAYLKGKIDNFYTTGNRLSSMFELLGSKRNVFSTLSNMFKNEYYSIKNSTPNSQNEETINDIRTKNSNFEEIIPEKISNLEKLIDNFIGKIRTFINNEEMIAEIENDIKAIKDELIDLSKHINNKVSGTYFKEDHGKSVSKLPENYIKVKLEGINILENYCVRKLSETERTLNIINRLKIVSGKINENLYPKFNEINQVINNENKEVNEFNANLNSLKSSKFEFENELYKINFKKEQIKEKVKSLTEYIIDNYNLSIEVILKDYQPSVNLDKSSKIVRSLKNELKLIGNVNPNATIEFNRVKERYNFLKIQREDLFESKKGLEKLITEIDIKIEELFSNKFEEIKNNFMNYFKILFPLGNGELQLIKLEDEKEDYGIDLKADINSNKFVPLTLLSGGEKALISGAFLFSIFATNFSPFYVFDEIDAALDDMNLNRFLSLVKKFSENRQIIIISHQKKTMEIANTIYGISMQSSGISKVVSEKMDKISAKVI